MRSDELDRAYEERVDAYNAGGPFPDVNHPDALADAQERRDRADEKGERLARHMLYGRRSGYVSVQPRECPVELEDAA